MSIFQLKILKNCSRSARRQGQLGLNTPLAFWCICYFSDDMLRSSVQFSWVNMIRSRHRTQWNSHNGANLAVTTLFKVSFLTLRNAKQSSGPCVRSWCVFVWVSINSAHVEIFDVTVLGLRPRSSFVSSSQAVEVIVQQYTVASLLDLTGPSAHLLIAEPLRC